MKNKLKREHEETRRKAQSYEEHFKINVADVGERPSLV